MSGQASVLLLSIDAPQCPISLTISIDAVSVGTIARIIHEGSSPPTPSLPIIWGG